MKTALHNQEAQHRATTKNSGFSMIEVLITILIFAIGLLGVAAMQVQSLKGTADSGQRGKAVWLAQELTERMRANPDAVIAGNYVTGSTKAGACTAAPGKMCSNYFNGSSAVEITAACSAAEMAAFDLWEVACGTYDPASASGRKGNTIDFLADADISVECTSCADPTAPTTPIATDADFSITVLWTGRGSGETAGNSATATDQGGIQKVELLVRP